MALKIHDTVGNGTGRKMQKTSNNVHDTITVQTLVVITIIKDDGLIIHYLV